jgi:hypothetical protein
LWLVNAKPTIDFVTGTLVDNRVTGVNATIELFRGLERHSYGDMRHARSFWNPTLITSPNCFTALGRETDAYYLRVSSAPSGFSRRTTAASKCPPHSTAASMSFDILPNHDLKKVDHINTGYALTTR